MKLDEKEGKIMTLGSLPVWLLAFGHMWGWGAGGWIFGIFMMVFWVVLVVLVVYLLVRGFSHHGTAGTTGGYFEPSKESPMEIARRRFAAGEITKEQLEEIEKTLKGT